MLGAILRRNEELRQLNAAKKQRLARVYFDSDAVRVAEEFDHITEREARMPIPTSVNDLNSFGYSYSNSSYCSGCGAPIEWWTTPRNKKMPFSVQLKDGEEIRVPHFSDCPKADQFRKPR